ncbi:MAG: oligoribonuclease [Gammaproteobacteria bacterium]|nr:MAG: oligoribonuclease [Gammaproteobacteria bacterium]
MAANPENLIWIDLEMTGLDAFNDLIIEIATIVTDKNLEVLAEGPMIAIHQSEETLDAMDEWNKSHHGKSGLIKRVNESKHTVSDAEQLTLEFLKQHVPAGKSPMCGNSICQDRRFMARLMPELESFFHYRNLDVSAIKELVERWRPDLNDKFSKKGLHLALDDIRESIDELKFYREYFLRLKPETD